jgi:hypothetical protein
MIPSVAPSARSRCSVMPDPTCGSISVRLDARDAGAPSEQQTGRGIVAVASGLVQVQIAGGTAAIRAGEVLVADSDRIEGWRNIGQAEAVLFWIVVSPGGPTRSPRS